MCVCIHAIWILFTFNNTFRTFPSLYFYFHLSKFSGCVWHLWISVYFSQNNFLFLQLNSLKRVSVELYQLFICCCPRENLVLLDHLDQLETLELDKLGWRWWRTWIGFYCFIEHSSPAPFSLLSVCVCEQGNKGNSGHVGAPGLKGDGFPGPQVRHSYYMFVVILECCTFL